MNIDYAACQALKFHTEGLPGARVLYNVFCKWFIHFRDRVNQAEFLSILESLKLSGGVGKFHINAHELACFVKFSPNFIKGLGQVDGEILETLWSSFNSTGKHARTMSSAHQREVYDDHMRHANWKKLVGMGELLYVSHWSCYF